MFTHGLFSYHAESAAQGRMRAATLRAGTDAMHPGD